jgi:hypothetical protein
MSEASDKVAQATTTIVLDHPFFASLLLSMKRIEDPSVDTACTNGVIIKYNPDFINSLSVGQVAGLLVHEVLHPALGHLTRLPRDKEGNIAGDYAINNFMDNYNQSAGSRKLDLPDGGCIDHEFDPLSCEQILAELRRRQPPQPPEPPKGPEPQPGTPEPQEGEGGGDGEPQPQNGGKPQKPSGNEGKPDQRTREQGAWGEFEDQAGGENGETPDEMNSEWERRVIQAATAAKMQGTIPACIEALIDEMVNPKVPWQQVLERFVDQTSANDYSWNRPDRRFLPDDIVLPDLQDETLGEIVIALDTSGSIYGVPKVVGAFQNEVNNLITRCKPTKVTIIQCDSRVTDVQEYHEGELVELKLKGGGGTCFEPVGEEIRKRNIDPRVCIYLTDLYGSFPEVAWDFPTIWCVYGNESGVAPFGETIHIAEDGE